MPHKSGSSYSQSLMLRYKILHAKGVRDSMSPEEATNAILDHVNLDPEQFRLGHTKVGACWLPSLSLSLPNNPYKATFLYS